MIAVFPLYFAHARRVGKGMGKAGAGAGGGLKKRSKPGKVR